MYVNTQVHEQIPLKVTKTNIRLQDMLIDLDNLTEIEDETIFILEQMPKLSFVKEMHVQMDITV